MAVSSSKRHATTRFLFFGAAHAGMRRSCSAQHG